MDKTFIRTTIMVIVIVLLISISTYERQSKRWGGRKQYRIRNARRVSVPQCVYKTEQKCDSMCEDDSDESCFYDFCYYVTVKNCYDYKKK